MDTQVRHNEAPSHGHPNTPQRGPLAWTPKQATTKSPRMDPQTRHNEAPSCGTQTQSLLVCTDDRDARHMVTPPSLPAPTGDPRIQPIQTQLRTEMLPSLHKSRKITLVGHPIRPSVQTKTHLHHLISACEPSVPPTANKLVDASATSGHLRSTA